MTKSLTAQQLKKAQKIRMIKYLKENNPFLKNKPFILLQNREEVLFEGVRYKFRSKKCGDEKLYKLTKTK